jgi:hypothetical protein
VIRQEGRGASVYALVQKSGGLFSRDVSRLERYEVR